MDIDLDQNLELARQVAWEASDILRHYEYQPDLWQVETHEDQSPVTAADQAVDRHILQRLRQACGESDFGYLTEETYQPGPPLAQEYVWVIDPLDGTKDFIRKTGDYAVHIALLHQGRPILAAVSWPAREAIYTAQVGAGTYREMRQAAPQRLWVNQERAWEDLLILTSRSHSSPELEAFLNAMPQQRRKKMGSIGCKIAAIAEQDADVYFMLPSPTSPKDWDLAGPELILSEAGGSLTRFDGSCLQYNRGDVNQAGGYLASNGTHHPALAQRLLAATQP